MKLVIHIESTEEAVSVRRRYTDILSAPFVHVLALNNDVLSYNLDFRMKKLYYTRVSTYS